MRYLPIHIDTQGKRVLVVGGGPAAEAKLRTLLLTEAAIHVVATDAGPEVLRWADDGKLSLEPRDFVPADLDSAILVYAATEDDETNASISELCRARGLPVNAADQKPACSFITPALVDRSPVVVSIGTEGTSPALARALKSDLETRLPPETGRFAKVLNGLRKLVKQHLPELPDRQRFWAQHLDRDLTQMLRLSPQALKANVRDALETGETKGGQVVLVGAGPGDPDLLTTQARRALHSADVIIYDRLVSDPVLTLGRREAEYVYVGKTPGKPSIGQAAINDIIVEKARTGAFVVRLKSGDPLVFGRADEELDRLRQEGIPASIVPGITAATAAAAAIGASLTTRGTNRAVAMLTGHDAKGFAEQDWASLSGEGARAAIYMGVGASRFIQGRLMLHGANPMTPITIVENASRPEQVIVATSLQRLPDDISAAGINGPAILLLGYDAQDLDMMNEAAS